MKSESRRTASPGAVRPTDPGPPAAAGGFDGMAEFCAELTRHQPRLRGLVRCLLFDRADVEDVLQDANVTLLRKAADYRLGTDFWAWASQVARYQVLTHCKRLRRDKLVFSDALLATLAEEAGSRATEFDSRREALDACLAKLPPPQRQLLELRYAPKASIEEIAKSLERTAGSIRQALFRIREALHACIERRLAGEAVG
jgi:RNA polymerase sigma-70 factor (ECF subfamily)